MQVEKDIIVACDYIEGNIYKKTGYRRVKLFTDQTLKSLKQIKLNNRDVLCKINSSDEVLDILSYKGNVLAYSDNRFDEYFLYSSNIILSFLFISSALKLLALKDK